MVLVLVLDLAVETTVYILVPSLACVW